MNLSSALRLSLITLAVAITGCGEEFSGPIAQKPISKPEISPTPIPLIDVVLSEEVPEVPLNQAFEFFDANRSRIRNRNWLTIIDFTEHSSQARMYVINLNDGKVDKLAVAHGEGSDPDHDGYARIFSNDVNSLMSSVGFYLVNESYYGKWGLSARMDGLSETNSKARERAIVLHGADYVELGRQKQGRSWGCPAVSLRWIETLVSRLTGRSLLYAYVDGLEPRYLEPLGQAVTFSRDDLTEIQTDRP